MIDFDKRIDRIQTASEKWSKEVLLRKFGRDDLLPFWVADMDFEGPPAVCDALSQRTQGSSYGYEVRPERLSEAIADWYSRRHDWQFSETELCFCPGTLNAISLMIEQHSSEGDGVIVQPPVYFEFQPVIDASNRTVVLNPLKQIEGGYEMDFDDLEIKAADPRNRLLILCSPHNPVGRVWSSDELERLGEICRRHQVMVVADEVHGDFVFPGHVFTPFASISKSFAKNSITCLSPAKTFGIPAASESVVVIPDAELRAQFQRCSERLGLHRVNAFNAVAMLAAYQDGEDWLNQAVAYVARNVELLQNALPDRVPGVRLVAPAATYMVWLDFRSLGLNREQLERMLIQEARMALKSGHSFGPTGDGFARMAIACPRSLLEEAVTRLEQVVRSIGD